MQSTKYERRDNTLSHKIEIKMHSSMARQTIEKNFHISAKTKQQKYKTKLYKQMPQLLLILTHISIFLLTSITALTTILNINVGREAVITVNMASAFSVPLNISVMVWGPIHLAT